MLTLASTSRPSPALTLTFRCLVLPGGRPLALDEVVAILPQDTRRLMAESTAAADICRGGGGDGNTGEFLTLQVRSPHKP